MAEVLVAVARSLPQVVDDYASKMYWTAKNRQESHFNHHQNAMLNEVRREALSSASDAAVLAWWEPERMMYIHALQAQDAPLCTALAGDARGISRATAAEMQSEYLLRLVALLDTLPEQEARTLATPEQLFRDGQAHSRLMQRAYQDLAGPQAGRSQVWSPLQRCAFIVSVHRQLQGLPATQRASMVRYLELQ